MGKNRNDRRYYLQLRERASETVVETYGPFPRSKAESRAQTLSTSLDHFKFYFSLVNEKGVEVSV